MKKKRSESKSTSNAKNGGAGSNDPQQHAGSSSSSSSSNANTANNALLDKHHNLSSPCSNLAAAIAQEIFPTITTTSTTSGAMSSSSSRMGGGAIIIENYCLGNAADHPNEDSLMLSGIKKSKAGKHMPPPPPSSSEEEHQPLLGYMIRRYLLDERIKAREAETAAARNNNSELKANGGNSITTTAPTTTTSTSIKKKKGKKKKKKKGSIPNGGEDMNENIIITEEQQTEQYNNDSGEEENECHPQHSSSSPSTAAVVLGEETPSTVASSLGNTTSTSPTATTNTSKQSRSYSGLDRLLDSILESEQQSFHSATILDNMDNNSTHHHHLHHRRTRGGYEMRTMESFSAYLRRKFEVHVEHTVQQQHTMQQKKEKFKGSSGGGGGGGGGGGVIASTTSTSSKYPKMKNSILRCGEGGSTALIDILPTISFKDVNDLVDKSIDCRKCRTSVTSRLRNLTTTANNNNNNNNNTSSTTTKDNFVPSPEGVEVELTNTTSTMMKQHPAIILNERSASRLRSTSTPALVAAAAAATNGHGLSIPVSGLFSEEDDIDSAFSYVNMDEVDLETGEGGGGGDFEKGVVDDGTSTDADANAPQLSSFHLELYPITEKNVVRYLQMTATGKTKKEEGVDDDNGTTSEQEYPMQTNDMINLVKYILLPCGLAENVLGDANDDVGDTSERYHLSSDDLSAIANEAFAYVNPIQSTVFRMAQSMNSIDEIMEQADHSNNRSIMDSMTPQLLKKADDKIEMLLKQVGDVIFQLFKAICSVGWSSKRGPKLLHFASYLWERHTAALDSLIGPTLQHRGNLLRGGVGDRLVPLAYSDIPVRNSLYQLMKAKTVALRTLVLEFSAIIKGDGESSPSALTEIFVLRAFREHVERAKEAAVDKVFPDQESEELMQHLIAAQIHLSQTTIITPLCSGIVEKAKEYRDTLDGLCRKMRKIIIAMEDFAPETKIEFLRRGYETNESSYYDLVKSHNSLCHTDAGFDAKDTAMLLKISVNLVMQWLILLCSRQYHESSMKSLALPSRLEKWLDSTTGTTFPNFMPNDIKVVVDECDGRGGERRISSIFAGLLYRWLEARCSEWHAELTRDELLQSMDMEEAILEHAESSKVGKKKKTKRKAGGDSSKRMDKIETNNVGGGRDHGVEELKRVELEASSHEVTGNTLEGRIDFEGETRIHVECGIDEDFSQQGSIDARKSSPIKNVSTEMASSTEACDSKCEYYYPCVGVVDGQQFVTAEMFLVNRLQVILGKRADSITPVSLA